MATPSNGPTLDLASARKRLSLIAIMAQTAMNRLHGNPGYLMAGLRLAATMNDHEEHILYLMIELDQALARKTPRWASEQRDVARRWLASLLERLLAIIPRS